MKVEENSACSSVGDRPSIANSGVSQSDLRGYILSLIICSSAGYHTRYYYYSIFLHDIRDNGYLISGKAGGHARRSNDNRLS